MKTGLAINALMLILLVTFNQATFADEVVATVKTQPLGRHTLVETLTGYGAVGINPTGLVSVNFPRSGQVTHLSVTQGQVVKKGQPILQFTTSPMESLGYATALSAVDFARSELERVQGLAARQLATQSQVARARKALSDAQAGLAAQQKLGTGIDHEWIKAPLDGIVSVLSVAPGDRIQAGTAALQLARLEGLRVLLGIEPEEIAKVKAGMPVILTSVFNEKESLPGTVSEVHGMINPQTQLVDVTVHFTAGQRIPLMPGMRVRGVIILTRQKGLAVPRLAVLKDRQGAYVWVVRKGRAERINVAAGIESDGTIGITGRFQPNDRVVVLGNYELQSGMAVREGK